MTRGEFEAFMDSEGWNSGQRALWSQFTPIGDACALQREMKRAGGVIEVRPHPHDQIKFRRSRRAGLKLLATVGQLFREAT